MTTLVTTHEPTNIPHITTCSTIHNNTHTATHNETHAATLDSFSAHSGNDRVPVHNLISLVNGHLKYCSSCPGYPLKLILDCIIGFTSN